GRCGTGPCAGAACSGRTTSSRTRPCAAVAPRPPGWGRATRPATPADVAGTSPGTTRDPQRPRPRGRSAWVRGAVGWRACLHYDRRGVARVMMRELASGDERDGPVEGV